MGFLKTYKSFLKHFYLINENQRKSKIIKQNIVNENNIISCFLNGFCDIETSYIFNYFIKKLGGSIIQPSIYINKINQDGTFFFGLNSTIDMLKQAKSYLIIGSNFRQEMGSLNLYLKKQLSKTNCLITSYTTQIKNLIAISHKIENTRIFYNNEQTQHSIGLMIQNIYKFLNKKISTKRQTYENASYLSVSLGSINCNMVGVNSGMRTLWRNPENSLLKATNVLLYQPQENTIQIATKKIEYDSLYNFDLFEQSFFLQHEIPILSMYEQSGHFQNMELFLYKYEPVIQGTSNMVSPILFLGVLLYLFWNLNDSFIKNCINFFKIEINLLNVGKKSKQMFTFLYFLEIIKNLSILLFFRKSK